MASVPGSNQIQPMAQVANSLATTKLLEVPTHGQGMSCSHVYLTVENVLGEMDDMIKGSFAKR